MIAVGMLLVAVGETAAAGLGIVIDAVVADRPGIVVVVGPLAAVETAQMRGSAGRATGQRPEGGSVPPPDDIVRKEGWGVTTVPEFDAGAYVRGPR